MATIKELMKIIEFTPVDQPILVEGIHGIGKSESIKAYFESKGFRVQILFLGQMSDAGDILGLPDRKEVTVGDETFKVTDFCPPSWWPRDPNEKVVLFLDELNRAKQELHQVIMDLVLNRKLYNRTLPKNTRIISAVNPMDKDGTYQVEEMDPALLDRFNIYAFKPTVEDWIDWATKEKIHGYILGFISKNYNHLDPDLGEEFKHGEAYPSRRSWVRVSNIIKADTSLLEPENIELLKTCMLGIVGNTAVSAFSQYIKGVSKGITPGRIITGAFNTELKAKLLTMNTQDFVHTNKQIAAWFADNEKFFAGVKTPDAPKFISNLKQYLDFVKVEIRAAFMHLMSLETAKGVKWPKIILALNPNLAVEFTDILIGNEKEKYKEEEEDQEPNPETF